MLKLKHVRFWEEKKIKVLIKVLFVSLLSWSAWLRFLVRVLNRGAVNIQTIGLCTHLMNKSDFWTVVFKDKGRSKGFPRAFCAAAVWAPHCTAVPAIELAHPDCPRRPDHTTGHPRVAFEIATYPYIASLSLLRASLTEEPILGGMLLVWALCGYWWECSWGPWLRCTACMDRAPCGSPYMVVGMPTPSIP